MDDLASWLAEWELELDAGRPGAESIRVYTRGVRQFLDWLADHHPDVQVPADVTRVHVRDWYAHLAQQGKAESTRRIRGISLRKFLGYIASEAGSGLDANPADGFELPVPQAAPVPVLSDDDLTALLKTMSGSDFRSRRDTAIVRLLLDTGLRRAELVGIDVDDLDMKAREVKVTGKGSRVRVVPFGSRTALALAKYLRVRGSRPQADGPALFLSSRADHPGARMTGDGLAHMISSRCQAAGLGHVHPHQLRHSWAADLKAAGISDDQLERLAGWTTPTMSRRYGSFVADEQARAAARRLGRGDRV